jgi:hypothetical protein
MAPPAGLTPEGKRLWRELVADVECVTAGPPAAASLVIVDQVVRAQDRLVEVRSKLASDGITTDGSRGQTRPHPLLVMERQLVAEVINGLERLELRPSRIRGARDLALARELTLG